jgi:hypothetical protein
MELPLGIGDPIVVLLLERRYQQNLVRCDAATKADGDNPERGFPLA